MMYHYPCKICGKTVWTVVKGDNIHAPGGNFGRMLRGMLGISVMFGTIYIATYALGWWNST